LILKFNALTKKTILVAPLFWGLGHAARCIPIIKALLSHNYNVLLGSDGAALLFLRKEFPSLSFVELPSYNIVYPNKGKYFKWKMFMNLPTIQKAILSEKKIVRELVSEAKVDGIISDNRFGVRSSKIPSVFITHQLNVLTGNTSFLSSKIHQKIINKFDQCWVPDIDSKQNLSGKLGRLKKPEGSIKYLGPLSRFQNKNLPIKNDILALISGPEPQRTFFENKLMEAFELSEKSIVLVQGVIEEVQKKHTVGKICVVNFMLSAELEKTINESEVVVSRSGYTTILDLTILDKKAFFIPTPGQYEQIYLAKRLKGLGIAPSCNQENFHVKQLDEINNYSGLEGFQTTPDFEALFSLFEGK
jgi:uncharacterized protein (TIGR00661 family)